jgi:hypothetical protein
MSGWLPTQRRSWTRQPENPLGGTLALSVLEDGRHVLFQRGDVPKKGLVQDA